MFPLVLPSRDPQLVALVDRALSDAAERGGAHLACRPGCTPCCHGVFRISLLDASRLRLALQALAEQEPARAAAITQRARAVVATLAPHFPGHAHSGRLLTPGATGETPEWDCFADLPEADGACPVLDPATGRCELYAARPLTCRVFGPPVRTAEGIGICELCYRGATEQEISDGEMVLTHEALEAELDRELAAAGYGGETVIAWALTTPMPENAAGRARPDGCEPHSARTGAH